MPAFPRNSGMYANDDTWPYRCAYIIPTDSAYIIRRCNNYGSHKYAGKHYCYHHKPVQEALKYASPATHFPSTQTEFKRTPYTKSYGRVYCTLCGKMGYGFTTPFPDHHIPAPWQLTCLRGHHACDTCGRILPYTQNGNPIQHSSHHMPKHPHQGTPMPQLSPRAYVSDRASYLRANLDATLQEIARLESRPKEPQHEDAVIWFQKTFSDTSHNGVAYTYVAVRAANNRWYTSAQSGSRTYYSWDSLLDFIEEDETEMSQIWIATTWEEVL